MVGKLQILINYWRRTKISQYIKGRNFEWLVRDYYYDNFDAAVVRSAGSKGMIDLVVLFPKIQVQGEMVQKSPHAVQCKDDKKEYSTMTKLEKMIFINYCEERGAIPILAIKMRKSKEYPDGIVFDHLLMVKLEMMGKLPQK